MYYYKKYVYVRGSNKILANVGHLVDIYYIICNEIRDFSNRLKPIIL